MKMFKQCDRDRQYHPVVINSLSLSNSSVHLLQESDINLFCNSTSKDKGKHAISSSVGAPLLYFSSWILQV